MTCLFGINVVENFFAAAVNTVVVAGSEGVGKIAVESVGLMKNR
jgi:hypothetical protein